MAKLPRPRVVSHLSRPGQLSLNQLSMDFSGELSWREERRVHKALRGFPAVESVDIENNTFTRFHIKLRDSVSSLQIVKTTLAILDMFQPLLRSCVVGVSFATRGSTAVAMVEVTCMYPRETARVMGPAVQRAFAPLGDARWLPNAERAEENVYCIAIRSYRAPDDLDAFLTAALEPLGLDVGAWREVEIPFREYLLLVLPRGLLN